MSRTFNFCAGPAALPQSVMLKAQQELLDWKGLGVSVMEVSHRSSEYQELANKAESDLRALMGIGEQHAVLFMHGGATHQFSNIPMGLLNSDVEAEYITNGIWSDKAADEASRFGRVNKINAICTDENNLRSLIEQDCWERSSSPVYTHYTPNETIEGLRFEQAVSSKGPLVADMSSCILSENIDVNDFDFIYAGAQKNIGPAGMTLVIVKHSLIEQMNFEHLPRVLNYQIQSKQGSMLNTPPTFAWYLASLVFEWLIEQGGVVKMEELAIEKSKMLYDFIDRDEFYHNPVAIKNRSRMNIPFIIQDSNLNPVFIQQATEAGLVGLKGHRSVGGMRASLYNSMPIEGVSALIDFMQQFKQKYG
ncbi:3-phosphoserine/phosphohydroxythreonine transaminase [Aliikangiella sp. IMCC44359]|uniref:3-phosphoserine/phosphohydroxythreonine transaminase n=1 Tax=Aliikangiella sp. IMCC44359 TaxID=3459125 RepID=UPI00403B256D